MSPHQHLRHRPKNPPPPSAPPPPTIPSTQLPLLPTIPSTQLLPLLCLFLLVLFLPPLLNVFVLSLFDDFPLFKPWRPTLAPSTPPTAEVTLSFSLLSLNDPPPPPKTPLLTCMPTVSRPNNVEYVSNAAKSFRLATNNSATLGHLVVFLMDNPITKASTRWLRRVTRSAKQPPWLHVLQREGDVRAPQKQTLGDTLERVQWRSKEVLDYAQVLRRCAHMATGEYILIAQDDVLFTPEINNVLDWANRVLVDGVREVDGRRKMVRVCSGSLFDLPGTRTGEDGHVLDSSNMVARLWRVDAVERVVQYLEERYDEAPVDWLVDGMCKGRRRLTLVMEPNPVKHRGKVSSFAGNQRDGMLT